MHAQTHIYMVLEYAELGDLFQTFNSLITRPGMSMPEPLARRLFMQLILGLDYCHKLGIPNRDIKLVRACMRVARGAWREAHGGRGANWQRAAGQML